MKTRLLGIALIGLLMAACGGGGEGGGGEGGGDGVAPVAAPVAVSSGSVASPSQLAATPPAPTAPSVVSPAAPSDAAPAAPNVAAAPAATGFCEPSTKAGETLFLRCNDVSLTPLLVGAQTGRTEKGNTCSFELSATGLLKLRLGSASYQASFDGDERDFSVLSRTTSFDGQSLNAHDPASGVQIFLIHSTDRQQIGALLSNTQTSVIYAETFCGVDPGVGPPAGSSATQIEISGTIRVADTADIDSDTNDVTQANWRRNDTVAQAQSLLNPVLVSGYVNRPRSGPPGRTFADGDIDDLFRINLQPGQVVELEFNGDPTQTDLDLWVYTTAGVLRGRSIGNSSRHECVRISAAGDYLIDVKAYAGAANYLLRIGSPSSASSCANATTEVDDFVANELIAKTRSASSSLALGTTGSALSVLKRAGIAVVSSGIVLNEVASSAMSSKEGTGPLLLRLSESASDRLKTLKGLSEVFSSSNSTESNEGLRRELPAHTLAQIDTLMAAKRLEASGQFEYIASNGWNTHLQVTPQDFGSLPSNDRYYGFQSWNYDLISLPSAFAGLQKLTPRPSRQPLVALIDSGVYLAHPDLAAMIARRTDGTVEGYDFIASTTNSGDGDGIDPNPDDVSAVTSGANARFHGTHTAGIIAAQGFNGDGVTGAAPMARLMPLRALGLRGGSDYDVIQAMLYASGLPNASQRLPQRRADVINLSLGRQGACSSAIQDAVRLARQQGVSVVAAAGNDASNRKGLPMPVGTPANCVGVISVGAVSARSEVADYSNSGADLTLVAPGGDLSAETTGSGNPDGVFSALAAFDNQGVRVATYGFMQGTSMAAPHVSAVIALVKYINPSLTPAQIDQLIASGQFTLDLGVAGRDSLSGYGLINASKALQAGIESINAPPPLGVVEVSPATLSFGSTLTEAEFELRRSGPTTETVTRITWTNPGYVQVLGKTGAYDSLTLLGRFVIRITRTGLLNSIFPVLTLDTSTGRKLTLSLSIEPAPAPGTAARRGSAGTIYLLVVDASDNNTIQTLTLEPRDGAYAYSTLVPASRPLYLVAGHDLDNDFYLCGRGEACGDYPPHTSGAASFMVIQPSRGLDFTLAPSGGFGAAAQPGQIDQAIQGRWRTLRKGAVQ